jgi:signal transduction histidine kinase
MNKKADVFSSASGWSFLIDSASVVVLRVSRSGTILAANRHARTLIGEPLVGQPWHSILLNFNSVTTLADWLAVEGRPRLLNVHTLAGLPQTLQVTVESDGADYLLFGEVNAGEQARLAREVLELNHELNNLTRELAINNVELAHLSALKNQFLGMAAHDLRKPTGLILTYAEFLIDEVASSLSVEHQDFLHTIHNAADRMRRVVDDFLDVSLIEAGRFDLDEQAVDLSQLVNAAVKLVNISATKCGVKISIALDPASLHLFVDGAKIEQVLTNLLSNAVENSSSGDCVTVTSQRLATELRVQVADKGPGMALAQQQGLFQAFASSQTGLKSSGERSIGLGLTIARKIVDAHGGSMLVQSAPAQGSIVGFTLPLSRLRATSTSPPLQVLGKDDQA